MPIKRRKPLQRKTPMKRSGFPRKVYPWSNNPKPRKPLAQKSVKQKGRDREYGKAQKQWLAANPLCAFCLRLGLGEVKATEVHHIRGRNGALLCDTRFFASSCRGHRLWPHENPVEARAAGLLASAVDWGVSAPE